MNSEQIEIQGKREKHRRPPMLHVGCLASARTLQEPRRQARRYMRVCLLLAILSGGLACAVDGGLAKPSPRRA
jgi:hypothetical protein